MEVRLYSPVEGSKTFTGILTGYEDGNTTAVMDGEIDGFINAYLKMNAQKQ